MTGTPSIRIRPSHSALLRYANAILLSACALILSIVLWPVSNDSPFIFFMGAVTLSAWFGGLGPGMLATLQAIISVNYFLIEPLHVPFGGPSDLAQLLIFSAIAFLISWTENHRRQSVRALQQARDELAAVLNGVSEGITAQDESGQIVYANEFAAHHNGFTSPQEMIQTSFEEMQSRYVFFDSDGNQLEATSLPRFYVFQTGQKKTLDFEQHFFATGEKKWVSLTSSPVKDETGSVKLAVNIFKDITERKRHNDEIERLNQELKVQHQRLERIIANVPGIVYEVAFDSPDSQRKLVYVSSYAAKMLGYPMEKYQSTVNFLAEIVHPDDLARVQEESTYLYKNRETGKISYRCMTQDGRVLHLQSHGSVITDAAGRPIGAIGVLMDVTKRHEIEQQLAQYMQALRRSNEELKQFAYVASHDLQEPLRKIKSYIQLIEQRYTDKLDEDGREFIGYAVDGVTRMRALIDDLLTYSRVQYNQDTFEMVDLNTVLDTVLNTLQLRIQDNNATITHDPLPVVHANRPQIMQLFQNLLSNAIKFRSEAPPNIHIGSEAQGDTWHFCIQDNGIGIDPQQQDRIFVMFQRLHHREVYPGTGIGLAICKRVIENHNGRIWVKSAPGKGAVFHFTLPKPNATKVTEHQNGSRADTVN